MTKHIDPRAARGILAVRADAGGTDMKQLLASLNKDWSEFKAAQAEKDQNVLKKFDDFVTTDKVTKIESNLDKLQSAIDVANERLAAAQLGVGAANQLKDGEYTKAFQAHVRKGEIQASLNKGADDEGGYLAPVEWDRTVTDELVQISQMRQIAQVQQISTAGFKKLYNLRGTGSGWVGETAARPETTTPEFGSLTFTTGEIYANPAATQQLLDDAAVNLEQWLANEVQTEFAYQEGIAFVSGNGTNKPNGFLTYATGAANAAAHPLGAILLKMAAGAAAVTTDELMDLSEMLPEAYQANARWVMNQSVRSVIRKLKNSDGDYIWERSLQAGVPSQILGFPVTIMPAMPNMAASAIPIAFGDFRRGYLIVDRVGLRVLRDPYTNKPYVHFYTTKRVGGGVQNPEFIKAIKMAAS